MAMYPVPPNSMLITLHQNFCKYLEKSVKKKLRDASTLKSNISNPHNRDCLIANVSRLVFCSVYGRLLDSSEINRTIIKPSSKNSPLFELASLARISAVFNPESLVKVHSAGDVSLITGWLVLKEQVSIMIGDESEVFFEPGRLVIPLSSSQDFVKVFIPCGGPDPETDKLPDWCKQYNLNEIIPVKPQQLHYAPGEGVLSGIAKQDWCLMKKGQVNVGDYVNSRGDYLVVKGVGVDFNSDAKNIVRFEKDFKKNVNKQKFMISTMPVVQGLCTEIALNCCVNEKLVSMILNKIDDDDIGILNISFRNACFNVLGFLTHDVAIAGYH